jgi:hypothetical protein
MSFMDMRRFTGHLLDRLNETRVDLQHRRLTEHGHVEDQTLLAPAEVPASNETFHSGQRTTNHPHPLASSKSWPRHDPSPRSECRLDLAKLSQHMARLWHRDHAHQALGSL